MRRTWTRCTGAACTAYTRQAVKPPWRRPTSRASRTFRTRTTHTAHTIPHRTWEYTLTPATISPKVMVPWCRVMVVSHRPQGINKTILKKDLYVTETCWRDAGCRLRKINIDLLALSIFFLLFFFFSLYSASNCWSLNSFGLQNSKFPLKRVEFASEFGISLKFGIFKLAPFWNLRLEIVLR